ncbi:hypothetical protein BGW80DRAFT_1556897 [Lactifluus volemus]|nr:hypothetical protein BGW80DRAFT_1556897 [Lactifluus volemus]
MSSPPSALFQPMRIGAMDLQHRVVMSPLTPFRADKDRNLAGGYANVPGVWSDSQIAGWKAIADVVHANGSFIFLQLWAILQTPASSAKREASMSWRQALFRGAPLVLRNQRLRPIFDGVEIHAVNGCLLDQFLQSVSNQREDDYGGSVENRLRFPLKVIDAVVRTVGAERTSLRLGPWSNYQDMGMKDPLPTFTSFIE